MFYTSNVSVRKRKRKDRESYSEANVKRHASGAKDKGVEPEQEGQACGTETGYALVLRLQSCIAGA